MAHSLKISSEVATALKEIIVSAIPRKVVLLPPMEVVKWIMLRDIAQKLHTKLFMLSGTLSLSLSVCEELALYAFLTDETNEAIVSLDPALLHFIQKVDKKIKTNVFLWDDLNPSL